MKQTGQGSSVSPPTWQAHLPGTGKRVGRLRETVLGAVVRKHGDAVQCRVLVTWNRVSVCLWVRLSLKRIPVLPAKARPRQEPGHNSTAAPSHTALRCHDEDGLGR